MSKAPGPVGLMCPIPDTAWIAPGAYIENGKQLFEVVKVENDNVTYENCVSQGRATNRLVYVADRFRLVKAAPCVPDNIERMGAAHA